MRGGGGLSPSGPITQAVDVARTVQHADDIDRVSGVSVEDEVLIEAWNAPHARCHRKAVLGQVPKSLVDVQIGLWPELDSPAHLAGSSPRLFSAQ